MLALEASRNRVENRRCSDCLLSRWTANGSTTAMVYVALMLFGFVYYLAVGKKGSV